MEVILFTILGIGVLLLTSYGFYTLFTEETQKKSFIEKIRSLAKNGKEERIVKTKKLVFDKIKSAAKDEEFETCVLVDIDIKEDIETILEKEGFIVYKSSSDFNNRLYINWENNLI